MTSATTAPCTRNGGPAISFSFALVSLVASCASVAVVYALTGSDEPDRWVKESLGGFLVMLGGVVGLGLVVYLLARWIG